jgi:hypothetical protein
MSTTQLADVQGQVQEWWSPLFTKQLRGSLMLGGLVDKKYQGSIQKMGNKVTVSQVNAPTGQLLTVGVDADTFSSSLMDTTEVEITANKRAVASYTFADLVSIQSLITQENPEVMESLKYAMAEQINNYLYSLVSPSLSAPDHSVSGVTDFNASQLAACRLLAATAKWPKDGQWYALLSPSYYSDLMNATTLASSDYGAADAPTISGNIGLKRFGFNIFEDDSRGVDTAVLFHPSFMHMVSQTEVQIKISDLHPLGQFGYKMSVDMIFGASLGIAGNVKHIKVYNT